MKPKYLVLIFSLLLFKDMSAQLRINIGVDTTTEKSKLTINFFNKYITDFKEDNEVDYTKYFIPKMWKNLDCRIKQQSV
jgi:hypothetical protein